MRSRGAWLGALLLPVTALALDVGDTVPDLAAQDQSGHIQRLQDGRSRVLYVDFWASWCAPCMQALPALQQLHARWRAAPSATPFEVLTVNVDTRRQDARRVIDRLGLELPVIFDPDGLWAERFALPAMPSGYLIGPDGRVRHVQVGYQADAFPELERAIASLLEEDS